MDIELRRKGITKLLFWEEYQKINPLHCYGYSQYCEDYAYWKSKQKKIDATNTQSGRKNHY